MDLKVEPKVMEAIEAFRSGKVEVCPGGGGKYGVGTASSGGDLWAGEGWTKVAVRLQLRAT